MGRFSLTQSTPHRSSLNPSLKRGHPGQMSSTKFTPLSSSADDSFKATMPAALKESIFRTILNYIMLPSPLILIVGLFFKNAYVCWFSVYLMICLMGRGIHAVASKIIFPAQLIAKEKHSWIKGTALDIEVESALAGEAGREVLRARKQRLQEEFNGHSFNPITPDDVVLDASYFPGNGDASPSGPTVIFFPANMQLYENPSSRQYIKMYTSTGINIVMFNYRGVSDSAGTITCQGTLLDGETMIQYVTQHLGVPDRDLILHGRSIGGGISATLSAIHPEVNVCSERSFASLYLVVISLFRTLLQVDPSTPMPAGLSFKQSCLFRMKKSLPGCVAGLCRCIGWDYPAAESWLRCNGHKWVFYHPEDTIIPLEASLYDAVKTTDMNVNKCRMEGDASESHNRPLLDEEVAWHLNMVAIAVGGNNAAEHDI